MRRRHLEILILVCPIVSASLLLFIVATATGNAVFRDLGVLHLLIALQILEMLRLKPASASGQDSNRAPEAVPLDSTTSRTQDWIAPALWLFAAIIAVSTTFGPMSARTSIPATTGLLPLCVVMAMVWIFMGGIVCTVNGTGFQTAYLRQVAHLFRELAVFTLLVAGTLFQPSLRTFVVVALLGIRLWTTAIATEGLWRMVTNFLAGESIAEALGRPFQIRVRLGIGAEVSRDSESGPPLDCGSKASRQSSTIWNVVSLLVCLCVACGVWLATGIVIIGPRERGVSLILGRIQDRTLGPGIHMTYPSPLGAVRRVKVLQLLQETIGFSASPAELRRTPLLWTKPHGELESPLPIGNGTELVAVNGVLQFRIANDDDNLKAFVRSGIDPKVFLTALARRVLIAETRAITLEAILAIDSVEWSKRLFEKLQHEARGLVPGVELVAFHVISVHPPLEVAASYLEVVNARIDAQKVVTESRVAAEAELIRSEMMAQTKVADARGAAEELAMETFDDTSRIQVLASLDLKYPDVVRQRLYCDLLSRALIRKRITLIDARLPPQTQLWFGHGEDNRARTAPVSVEGK